jgi:hypothetical protein
MFNNRSIPSFILEHSSWEVFSIPLTVQSINSGGVKFDLDHQERKEIEIYSGVVVNSSGVAVNSSQSPATEGSILKYSEALGVV